MKVIEGNLINLALRGHFDVIGHGVNCFCLQRAGIACALNNVFGTGDSRIYSLEGTYQKGDKTKLGLIQGYSFSLPYNVPALGMLPVETDRKEVTVLNCYTQYSAGIDKVYLDYEALAKCLTKINEDYEGKEVGLPKIGCGLAGGDWKIVSDMMQDILTKVSLTVVIYK